MDLVALEDLRRLKYRYLRALDLKQWDEFATTLTADATAHYGDRLSFTGRDEIVHYMSQTVGPGIITVHHCHHPEIEVDGDRATGRWALEDTVIITDHQAVLHGAAFYEDRYVRTDDEAADPAHRVRAALRGHGLAGRPAQLPAHCQPLPIDQKVRTRSSL